MASYSLNNEIRIAMVGKTGVGKSSLGNSILGKNVFKESTFAKSETSHCQYDYIDLSDGTSLCILDTPGVFDTARPLEEIQVELGKCVKIVAPGPHVFLLTLSLNNRFTKEEMDTITILNGIFGEDVTDFVVIVFTGKDRLKRSKNSFDQYLQNAPTELNQLIGKCDGRCVAVDNYADPGDRQSDVRELLKVVRQTIQKHGGRHYTNAMLEEAEKAMEAMTKKLDEEIHTKEKQLQNLNAEIEQKRESADMDTHTKIKEGINGKVQECLPTQNDPTQGPTQNQNQSMPTTQRSTSQNAKEGQSMPTTQRSTSQNAQEGQSIPPKTPKTNNRQEARKRVANSTVIDVIMVGLSVVVNHVVPLFVKKVKEKCSIS